MALEILKQALYKDAEDCEVETKVEERMSDEDINTMQEILKKAKKK
jgi:hypothetical protein